MDPDSFKLSLARLYQSLNLVRTARGNYRTLPVNRVYEPEEARFQVVKRLILSFGIVSAEGLGMLLKGEIPMAELRKILLRLEKDDVLVIAGKGHEQTQTIGIETLPFDDVSVVKNTLNNLNP